MIFFASETNLAHNWSIHMLDLVMVWWIAHHFYVTLNIDRVYRAQASSSAAAQLVLSSAAASPTTVNDENGGY